MLSSAGKRKILSSTGLLLRSRNVFPKPFGYRAFSTTRPVLKSPETSETLTINNKKITIPTGLYINGSFVPSIEGHKLSVENPATGQELLQVYEGREADVNKAVDAARKAFDDGAWCNSHPLERSKYLNNLADIVEKNSEELAIVECAGSSKTFEQCMAVDIPAAIAAIRYFAGWTDKVRGETAFDIPGTFAYTKKEPYGVCGQIVPWNYPLMMFVWKIAPALATGNTVVIKAAETTPLSALKMCEWATEAGFPKGVLNLVNGYGNIVGAAIANHMDIDKVAFTGSTATGRSILKASANSNFKPVTLELGGKSPNIVFPDCDIEEAVRWAAWGINMMHGQTCTAGTRIYVHEDIYDKFLSAFTAKMQQNKVGAQFEPGVNHGPANSKMQFEKVMAYIETGIKEGATLHLGGKPRTGADGYFIEPTIFTDVRPDMKIVQDEIFGSVVCISKFKTEKEVLRLANNTRYGLAAAVHTKDYARALRVTGALKAGTTWVNMYNFITHSMPFGGYKESGIGRECGEAVLANYMQTKTVYFNAGTPAP